MDKARIAAFIDSWNEDFPNYPMTAADLSKPHAMMNALYHVFDRLCIDTDAVQSPPPEENCNDHIRYYRDLIPVINMTLVINHLVSVMPQVHAPISVTVTHFLQPTVYTSHCILLLLVNLTLFNEERLRDIAPQEEELFAKSDQVKKLEDRKNKLLELMNEQAEEKGKRSERLEKLYQFIKQLEEELKQEKGNIEDKHKLEAILKENHQMAVILEQKKNVIQALLNEVERKRALRVYDADDVNTQVEQAAQNVKEVEEKLSLLRPTLMQKENCLKNLQTIKPSFITGNNLLHEIMKLSESWNDYESGDLDTDSKEGELEVLSTELNELQLQLAEIEAARKQAAARKREGQARRQQESVEDKRALCDKEEKVKNNAGKYKKAQIKIQEIKARTTKYEEQKTLGLEELARIKNDFSYDLKAVQDTLIKKTMETQRQLEDKLRERKLR